MPLSLAHLQEFVRTGLTNYHRTRNQLGSKAGSRLSPWLAIGCLSARGVYAEAKASNAAEEGVSPCFFSCTFCFC